jgi:hypothetical protein
MPPGRKVIAPKPLKTQIAIAIPRKTPIDWFILRFNFDEFILSSPPSEAFVITYTILDFGLRKLCLSLVSPNHSCLQLVLAFLFYRLERQRAGGRWNREASPKYAFLPLIPF